MQGGSSTAGAPGGQAAANAAPVRLAPGGAEAGAAAAAGAHATGAPPVGEQRPSASPLEAAGLHGLKAPFAAPARPAVPVPALAAEIDGVWRQAGLDRSGRSEDVVGAIEAAGRTGNPPPTDGGPEAAHADRIVPVMRAVSAELAAGMSRAAGVQESPYESSGRREPSARAVARVVSSREVIEAVGVAAAASQLFRTIARRPPPQVNSKRAGGVVAQAEQSLALEAEQVAMIADMARSPKRARAEADTAAAADAESSSSSSSSSAGQAAHSAASASAAGTPPRSAEDVAADRLDADLAAVPPSVAARLLAKRARVAVDTALVPPANVASDNAASAFALWASAELTAMAKPPMARGRDGLEDATSSEGAVDDSADTPAAGSAMAEADVALVLLRRWHALGKQSRAKWQSRALTLAAAGALRPVAASDLRPAEAAHAAAAAGLAGFAPGGFAGAAGPPLGGVVHPGAVSPFLRPEVRRLLDAATAADGAAAAVVSSQPRVDDLPHVPTRPFCQFVRAARGREQPSARGFASSAEFMGAMREAWGSAEEAERAAAAQQSFAKSVMTRNDRLQRWLRTTEASERQGLREAASEAVEAVGAEAPPGLDRPDASGGADGKGPPRPPLTPFMAFAVTVRRRMRQGQGRAPVRMAELSSRDAEEMQALGQSWRALPAERRAVFVKIAAHDAVRFGSEQRAWEARTAIAAARGAVQA